MPSLVHNSGNYPWTTGARRKPWKARVKEQWVEYFLGYFATKEEAETAENQFRENSATN